MKVVGDLINSFANPTASFLQFDNLQILLLRGQNGVASFWPHFFRHQKVSGKGTDVFIEQR